MPTPGISIEHNDACTCICIHAHPSRFHSHNEFFSTMEQADGSDKSSSGVHARGGPTGSNIEGLALAGRQARAAVILTAKEKTQLLRDITTSVMQQQVCVLFLLCFSACFIFCYLCVQNGYLIFVDAEKKYT